MLGLLSTCFPLALPHTLPNTIASLLPPSPFAPQIVGPIQVARRSDMDMNGHVNNVSGQQQFVGLPAAILTGRVAVGCAARPAHGWARSAWPYHHC